jgi:ABC-2 type transport system ATP-binding protein
MKQRLGLCSVLIGDPEVLVLDEPANGVDAQGIADIRRIILDKASEGKTIIMASHILDEVEKVCTHVGILKNGGLIDSGAISSVLSSDDTIEVAADNMEALAKALADFPGTKGVEKETRLFRVTIEPETDAASLNRFLADQGIFVSHLSRCKQSLESHFLELLNGES